LRDLQISCKQETFARKFCGKKDDCAYGRGSTNPSYCGATKENKQIARKKKVLFL